MNKRTFSQMIVVVLAFALLVSACGSAEPTQAPKATPTSPTVPTVAVSSPTPTAPPAPTATRSTSPTASPAATPNPTATLQPPTPTRNPNQPKYGGTLTAANRGDMANSDPFVSSTITSMAFTMKLGGWLARVGRTDFSKIEPWLASSWEVQEAGKVWVLQIRQDAKWSDGVAFTAEDVKFWIDLAVFPPTGRAKAGVASQFGNIGKVDVLAPYTVRITLKTPQPQWLEPFLQQNQIMIFHPKHLMQPKIDAGNVKVTPMDVGMVGVGPYRFVDWKPGSTFRVERNPLYFEKDGFGQSLPYLDSLTMVIIPERLTMVANFIAGRVDETASGSGAFLTPEDITGITKAIGKDAWWAHQAPWTPWMISFNTFQKPWDDVRVRQAVNLWMDRLDAGLSIPGSSAGTFTLGAMFLPGTPYANADVAQWPGWVKANKQKDRDEARRLLKEAGAQKAAFTVLMKDVYREAGEYFVSELIDLGFDAKLQLMDTPSWTSRRLNKDFSIGMDPIGFPFPVYTLQFVVDTRTTYGIGFNDEQVMKLYQDALTMSDPVKLQQTTKEIERLVAKEKVYMSYLGWSTVAVAFRGNVKGIPTAADTRFGLERATAWIER